MLEFREGKRERGRASVPAREAARDAGRGGGLGFTLPSGREGSTLLLMRDRWLPSGIFDPSCVQSGKLDKW